MAAEVFLLDPTTEDATNAELSIHDGTNFRIMERKFPPPKPKAQFASSADTEGEFLIEGMQYENRTIPLKLRCYSETQLGYLAQKLGKINREGGTFKWTSTAGRSFVFDLLTVDFDPELGHSYSFYERSEIDITFTAKPFARGPEVQQADRVETTLPHIVFTETGIKGDVPALGRLVIDDDSANDQWFLVWGVQGRYYDSAASAALFYEAEGRTAQGGSATAAGPTGASGAGSNVMRNTALTTTYQSVLSTQATGGGAHLSHVGDFDVWARVQVPTTNQGNISVRLSWAEGDFRRYTDNEPVAVYATGVQPAASATGIEPDNVLWRGRWQLVNLGQVHLTKVVAGTQRWEGRIFAQSSYAGDDIDVDCFWLIPTTEGSGEVRGLPRFTYPTSFLARDEFDQASGALAGKTLPVGGTWAGAGDADDFSVSGSGLVTRTAVSDGATSSGPRFAIAGTTTYTDTLVQVDFKRSADPSVNSNYARQGVFVRYTDTSNFWAVMCSSILTSAGMSAYLFVYRLVSGTGAAIFGLSGIPIPLPGLDTWATIRLVVDAGGRYFVWFGAQGISGNVPIAKGSDSALATGGALASGKVGFLDQWTNSNASTRTYDNFLITAPVGDAAAFASQSIELRHDRIVREDSGGTLWQPPSKVEGDFLRIPAAGREGRTTRLIAKLSRSDPDYGPDSAIDDISARLNYTPRFLTIPEP